MVSGNNTKQQQLTQNPQKVILATGLSIMAGMVTEEYLPRLRNWPAAFKTFTEMRDDAVIGALLESIKTPLLSTPFEVHAASEADSDKRAAEFLEQNLFSSPDIEWDDHTEDGLEFLDYGFSISEKALEKRSDGHLWLKALTPVGQETLRRWGDRDSYGNVTGFIQTDENGIERTAAMDKLVHFVYRGRKRNPHGNPLLRSIYRPWVFKKNLEVLEAIGVERDVGNAPVAELGEGHYTDEDLKQLKDALSGFRMDENLYVIMPHDVKLTAYAGGNKVYDSRLIIRDYQHLIRQRFFADFLSLGAEQVGTQALAREMTTFFGLALKSVQNRMMAVWNRQLVPWLFRFNPSFLGDEQPIVYPKLFWTLPGRKSLQELAQSISFLVSADALTVDPNLEAHIRTEAGLPPISASERSKLKAEKAAATEAKPKLIKPEPGTEFSLGDLEDEDGENVNVMVGQVALAKRVVKDVKSGKRTISQGISLLHNMLQMALIVGTPGSGIKVIEAELDNLKKLG